MYPASSLFKQLIFIQESGEIIRIGDMEIYKVGEGVKCIIWCHDLAGYTGPILKLFINI